jgi:hypothetical protein
MQVSVVDSTICDSKTAKNRYRIVPDKADRT